MEYKQTVDDIKNRLDEKLSKILMVDVLSNLLGKTRDIEDEALERLTVVVVRGLSDLGNSQEFNKKEYIRDLNNIKKHVRTTYGYIARGELKSESMGIGIALGVAAGAALISFNGSLIAVGIAVGLAIGSGVGISREKKEEEKGNIY